MNYVIGDIHGEISKLKSLIKYILIADKDPTLIFIGDYIDKGEDSFETLRYLVQLCKQSDCVFLWGNHEYCWENVTLYKDYLVKYGGQNTIDSFGTNNIIDTRNKMFDLFPDFFDRLKNYYIILNYVIVHSGIPPQYYYSEIEKIKLFDLLFNRYEFLNKQQLYLDHYKIIFGHTGFYAPYIDPYKIGIDTSACYIKDQPLTAFCIENRVFLDSFSYTIGIEDYSTNICPTIPRVKPWRSKE